MIETMEKYFSKISFDVKRGKLVSQYSLTYDNFAVVPGCEITIVIRYGKTSSPKYIGTVEFSNTDGIRGIKIPLTHSFLISKITPQEIINNFPLYYTNVKKKRERFKKVIKNIDIVLFGLQEYVALDRGV